MFKTMDSCKQGKRINTLTGDTSNALHVTLLGMVDLIKTLLSSDRVEGEFGIYRQTAEEMISYRLNKLQALMSYKNT